MTTSTKPRIDLATLTAGPAAAMREVEARIELDPRLHELVKLRTSLINGCAFCIDMHWTSLRRQGESDLRLAQLAAWQESPYFDERERAALALTDAVSHVSATHVPDAVWARAEAQAIRSIVNPEKLAHLGPTADLAALLATAARG
jgi:AhpD family alkylhydroperoxidase